MKKKKLNKKGFFHLGLTIGFLLGVSIINTIICIINYLK